VEILRKINPFINLFGISVGPEPT